MAQQKNSQYKALVLSHSLFGNTKMIADALAQGLASSGIETVSKLITEVHVEELQDYDFVAIGAPTHNMGAPKEVKKFLEQLATANLTKTSFFAFDTKYKMFLNNPKYKRFENGAAKNIELSLVEAHATILRPRASGIVKGKKGPLDPQATTEFRQIGQEIATLLQQQSLSEQATTNAVSTA